MSFRSIVRDVRDSLGSFSRVSNGTHERSKSYGALVETLGEDLAVIKNTRWANLPAPLLRDVMRRLDESESKWPARKQVVACAGVCKTWRLMCKDIVKSPEFSRKLTFPVSLKQPGTRDGTIHCFIKRDKSNMTYHLYLSLSPALLGETGKFLLSAKRTRRTSYTEYVISMDANNISRSSSTYIGKMRSNFLGTKFIIYDTALAYNSPRTSSPKVSPKVPSGSYNIGQVTYELNVFGTRGPRKMHCIMHSIPTLPLEPGSTVPDKPENLQRSLDESFHSFASSKIINHSGDISSARFSDIVGLQEKKGKEGPLVLTNKTPRWHQKLQCWCLYFKDRVTIKSVKNFQLISAATVQPSPPSQKLEPSDNDKIILQFGKVGKDMFTMDYSYPLSAFQAFTICLSSFDTKLACE
ncbi:hypothetical protein CARUB_v10009311mg [Capsella rubella]|uniref:Tubby-like F-box protein n=1 Tax=Capsella rubella TaxID=81985 RepID=R0IT63_9BRAS|nr:tubby-like F-box protein 5 [Capsella rubella]EOA40583.1 hypothetical protein CARUB_v10009311mg [Capsella rubella]